MPYRDGTGPQGAGPLTGRGLGSCGQGLARGRGGLFGRNLGLGRGLGFGRRWTQTDERATLDEEEQILKEELAQIQEERKTLKSKK